VAAERTGWADSFSLANPSGRENLRRRQVTEQRTVTGLSPEYIKTPARPVQRVARTRRGFKTQSETTVPRTARARATAAPRTTRPVALTPRRDKRRLWQEKRATLRLRHNDSVKKGAPRHLDFVFFPFFLFLSLTTGTGKEGYPERDPSPRGKRAPSPPTDQRFEGWPLGGVQQPPQSARAPRPLMVRGSRAGPSEGFNGRLRPLGLRAHY
jgi:hypothetical protein